MYIMIDWFTLSEQFNSLHGQAMACQYYNPITRNIYALRPVIIDHCYCYLDKLSEPRIRTGVAISSGVE